MGAGIGAATGAASGGLKGALVGAVGGAAGAAVKSFTGGAVTVGLSYSAENGFGASVGVGYGPATVSVGISERGGTTVDLGLKSGAFNAGLSYNSKTRSVSGNAGLTTEGGTGFALSYNEGDGFGASISKSLDSGVNGSLSWSEKGGVGGNIGYEAPGDKNQPKNSLANQMKGAGGSLSFNQRDGVSASVSASGGVNAGNWSQSGGFQANTNFLADQWKADFVSKQDEIEQAKTDAESKAAQDKNNSESGKSVLDGVAISTQRREGEDGLPAHGAPGDNSPVKSREMSGSVDSDGKPTGSKKPGVQADGSINIVGSKTPTLGERASSLFDSVVGSAKGLWNKAFGGGTPQGVYNSSGIEAGKDKVLNSKAAYDPGYEQKGANWTPGKLANGEKYSNISYTETTDANGNKVYQKVYRNYHADGTYTVAGTESSTKATFDAAKGNSDFRRFTSCNMVNHEISQSFGAVSPFMPEKGGTQYYAGQIYTNLQNGKYNTDTHQYRQVGFQDAEKNASRGGLSIAVSNTHIVTLTGGYSGTQGRASNLNIFQGGASGVGSMPIHNGFLGDKTRYSESYFDNGKKLQYYVWEQK
ncbi:hypothetical protein [Leptospira sp. Fiocruz LV3954]|uniref:hypothetical protein n=2 Tax=unclassified Leptospira TaxID=2633828 RepID=UPI001E617B8D|nr:hypothetical protein [Leptospira sp. Fiocruz LV3954]